MSPSGPSHAAPAMAPSTDTASSSGSDAPTGAALLLPSRAFAPAPPRPLPAAAACGGLAPVASAGRPAGGMKLRAHARREEGDASALGLRVGRKTTDERRTSCGTTKERNNTKVRAAPPGPSFKQPTSGRGPGGRGRPRGGRAAAAPACSALAARRIAATQSPAARARRRRRRACGAGARGGPCSGNRGSRNGSERVREGVRSTRCDGARDGRASGGGRCGKGLRRLRRLSRRRRAAGGAHLRAVSGNPALASEGGAPAMPAARALLRPAGWISEKWALALGCCGIMRGSARSASESRKSRVSSPPEAPADPRCLRRRVPRCCRFGPGAAESAD